MSDYLIQWPRAKWWEKTMEPRDRVQAMLARLRELLCGGMGKEVRAIVRAARDNADSAAFRRSVLREHDRPVRRVVRYCEIEGHRYLVGMSSGYSTGARTIVHAESCPCKTNKGESK